MIFEAFLGFLADFWGVANLLMSHGLISEHDYFCVMKEKDSTHTCASCKSISTTEGARRLGWCLKFKKTVKLRGTCFHYASNRPMGRYEQVCHPIDGGYYRE